MTPWWAFPPTLVNAGEPTVATAQHTADLENEELPVAPPTEDEEVIPPPPTGDEGIYKEAPNPEAGHDEEVIPPADVPDDDAVIDTNASD